MCVQCVGSMSGCVSLAPAAVRYYNVCTMCGQYVGGCITRPSCSTLLQCVYNVWPVCQGVSLGLAAVRYYNVCTMCGQYVGVYH